VKFSSGRDQYLISNITGTMQCQQNSITDILRIHALCPNYRYARISQPSQNLKPKGAGPKIPEKKSSQYPIAPILDPTSRHSAGTVGTKWTSYRRRLSVITMGFKVVNADRASRTTNQLVTGNVTNSIPLIFADMLSNTLEINKVYIKSVIILSDFSASTKITNFYCFSFQQRKSPPGCRASRVFDTAGGDLLYWVCS
jgi:hypothetical protein